MTSPRPMRRWLRWLMVRVLAFTIRRRPRMMADLRAGLERGLAHRAPGETAEIWAEACRRAAGYRANSH